MLFSVVCGREYLVGADHRAHVKYGLRGIYNRVLTGIS